MHKVLAFLIFGAIAIAATQSVRQALDLTEEYFKEAENKPSMNTNNWSQHQRRLIRFGESKYRHCVFYLDSKNEVYYISSKGEIVYCE